MKPNVVEINGKEFEISRLKCKHLKAISLMLKDGVKPNYEQIDRFMPIATESIQKKNPSFTQEMLEDIELQEFLDVWQKILSFSGSKVVAEGEQKPVASTGDTSTQDSASPSAGPTVM